MEGRGSKEGGRRVEVARQGAHCSAGALLAVTRLGNQRILSLSHSLSLSLSRVRTLTADCEQTRTLFFFF